MPPAEASTRFSTTSCRSTRPRPAPMAARTATSLGRAVGQGRNGGGGRRWRVQCLRQDAREQDLSIVDHPDASDDAGVSVEGAFEEGVRQEDRVYATRRQAAERRRRASEVPEIAGY